MNQQEKFYEDVSTGNVGIATKENEFNDVKSNEAQNDVKTQYKLKKSQKVYIFFKSIIDWIIAFLTLVVLSPFWIILAIAIRIDSKGPAIFKHSRIGKNGQKFKCWKWRSMSTNAPKHIASRDFNNADSYITRVGGFIRKTSIDEFAQLFNILTFKMALIGYRPLVEKEKEIDELRRQKGIYQIKPGITGWAQVHGRDLVTNEQKANLDEYYLKHMSLWLDIKIFFMTIRKIFKRSDIKEGSIEKEIATNSQEVKVNE